MLPMIAPSETDAEEKRLAAEIVKGAGTLKAPLTFKRYTADWKGFQIWCAARNPPRTPLPAAPSTAAMFLFSVFERAKKNGSTYMVVKAASAAIFSAHELALVPIENNPTKSTLAKAVRGQAKRELGTTKVNQKDPLEWGTIEGVILLYTPLGVCTLQALTVGTMMAVMFVAFFRYSDAALILGKDVKMYSEHMEIFLFKRKNDQLREGDVVCVAKREDPTTCPVALTQRLIAKHGGKAAAADLPLFRGFDGHKKLTDPTATVYQKAITYDQCRRQVLNALAKVLKLTLPEVTSAFGTQSMRAGGATAVALKVDERLFQRHGAWKTVSARNGYVRDTTAAKLSVTKAIYEK